VSNTNANTYVPNGNKCAILRPNGSSVLQLRFSIPVAGFSFVGRNWASSVNITATVTMNSNSTSTILINSGSVGNVLFVGWLSSTSTCSSVTFATVNSTSIRSFGQVAIDNLQVACRGEFKLCIYFKNFIDLHFFGMKIRHHFVSNMCPIT